MDVKDIFKKCISVRELEDGWLMPIRFTAAQEARYDRIQWTPYQRCPAGVTMEFVTDADTISFDYKILARFFHIFYFDVFENGVYRGYMEIPEGSTEGTLSYKKVLPGTVEFKIYLPVHSELAFKNFNLGFFGPAPEKNYKHRLLMIGDSISQGLFARHPSLAYIPQIAEFIDADYLNNSVGGDIYDPDTIDAEQGFDPDVIIASMGTNDMCFVGDYDKISDNMDRFFKKLSETYPKAKVNVVSMPWSTLIETPKFSDMFVLYKKIQNGQLEKAKKYGFHTVLGWNLIPHHQEFYHDDAHPNDLGACQFALHLLKQLDY